MTDEDIKKLRGVVKEEVNGALGPIDKKLTKIDKRLSGVEGQLNNPEHGLGRVNGKLDALWDQTMRVTEKLEEVQETFDSHTAMLKKTSENIGRLDKRVKTVESHLGVSAPPELSIIS